MIKSSLRVSRQRASFSTAAARDLEMHSVHTGTGEKICLPLVCSISQYYSSNIYLQAEFKDS